MGNWKLEAFKMFVYMAFPVGCFVVFNTPSLYEEALYEWRKEQDKWTDREGEKEMGKMIKEYKKVKMAEKLRMMNEGKS